MIVDEKYYLESYGGEEIKDFTRLSRALQSLIEFLTSHTVGELEQLPTVVLDRVKQAICAEIEYLDTLGGIKALNGKPDVQKKSESYGGSYSYSLGDKQMAEIRYVGGIPCASMIETILTPTGLLYAGRQYV